jgi:hypothetical protein
VGLSLRPSKQRSNLNHARRSSKQCAQQRKHPSTHNWFCWFWLLASGCSSQQTWHKAYSASSMVKVHQLLRTCDTDRFNKCFNFFDRNYGARSTSYSAVCASLSTLAMAQQHGMRIRLDDWRLQRIAGRTASIKLLIQAHEYGMPYSHQVLVGAVESGDINTMQCLHNEQGCAITSDLSAFAAASGHIHVLNWLLNTWIHL